MMVSKLQNILLTVQKKITPSIKERKRILMLAEKLRRRVEEAANSAGLDVDVRVEGSIAKDTWLKEAPDIDIFMQVPSNTPREAFGTTYLAIAKKATKGAEQVERFAEHPYLEAFPDGTRVNIVPCYRAREGEWKSATDRTPFHTDYVKPLLNEKLCGETRLLKQFMKGTGVYGAEIKAGGFSGYLCELLVLFYGSFQKVLKASGNWKPRTFIDLEGHYRGREKQRLIFEEPLVIVDPVDKGRNAAAAVRRERLDEFIAASRAFFKNLSVKFFYPPETKPASSKKLLQAIRNRGTSLVFIQFGEVKAVPDILWGQLYRSQRSLRKLVKQHHFKIIQDSVWSDEKTLNVLLIEVESRLLPPLMTHLGPPLEKRAECEKFLKKHVSSAKTLSGPRLEEGRWVVEVKRKYTDVATLLRDRLNDRGGRNAGIPELVSQTLAKDSKILVNEEILSTYSRNRDFARFLTEYIWGKPKWLA
jgi:tRNA nucleotidyltransferase (CCA-adding enzyme)